MMMARFFVLLLAVGFCHMAESQDSDLLECADQDTCLAQSTAMSLVQLNVQKKVNDTFKRGELLQFSTEESGGYWVYGTYHKTGCELVRGMGEKLLGEMPEYKFFSKQSDFSYLPFENWYYQPDMTVLHSLPDYRFVHMIRDPADLIVSAYRFHILALEEFLQNPMNSERFWIDQFYGYLPKMKLKGSGTALNNVRWLSNNVPEAHQAVLRRFFDAVNDGKTLPEFYKSESETDGIVIEAYRSWFQIDMMTDNYEATRNDEKAVQVRMEDIKEHFEDNMKCIFNFLNEAHPFDIDRAMELVDPLDIQKYGAEASAEHDAGHITKKVDNSALFEVLKTVPYVDVAKEKLSKSAVGACTPGYGRTLLEKFKFWQS